MSYYDILLAKQLSGGGGDITVESLSVTENGTYTAPSGKAYTPVSVAVPQPTGTKSITTNGTHDVTQYASASVNVPNSYTASDEGKVVSSGALVAQTSQTIDTNGTYDTTLKNEVVVNVSGGGGGGLEYETGTWTPEEDSTGEWISFVNSHTVPPAMVAVSIDTSDVINGANGYYSRNLGIFYYNWKRDKGTEMKSSSSVKYYGQTVIKYLNASGTIANVTKELTTPDTDTSSTSLNTNSCYWVASDKFRMGLNTTSILWKAGKTYKWTAIWAPTS